MSQPMWSTLPAWPQHPRPGGLPPQFVGQHPPMLPTHYTFPPQPPQHPPPPPPGCPTTPHRYYTTAPKSPSGISPSQTTSPAGRGHIIRSCEIPPVDTWKPDSEFHDTGKVNGLDFPLNGNSVQQVHPVYKDIEGMDPLQVPLWKFLYQGLHNNWLRRICETYMSSLLTTLGPRSLRLNLSANFDLAILTSIASRPTDLAIKGPTSSRRKPLSRWRKTLPSRFNLGFPQQRQLTPLANRESWNWRPNSPRSRPPKGYFFPSDPQGTSNTAGMTPIQQALHGRSPSTSTFDQSSLLVVPGTVKENRPASLTDTSYKKWLRHLELPQPKAYTLEKNIQKVLQWWQNMLLQR